MRNLTITSPLISILRTGLLLLLVTSSSFGQILVDDDQTNSLVSGGTAVDMGLVTVNGGISATKVFTIRGDNQAITLGSISLDASDHYSITTDPSSQTIDSGNTAELRVRFNPASHGTHQATLTIPVTSPRNTGSFIINLTGMGEAPEINVSVDASGVTTPSAGGNLTNSGSVTFDSTAASATTQATFTISNTGNRSLTWTAANIVGHTEFSIANGPTTPTTIAANASSSLVINFQPTAAGAYNATLTLATDDPITGSFTVSLTGNGLANQEIRVLLGATRIFDGAGSAAADFTSVNLAGDSTTTTSQHTFTIQNAGEVNLTVTSIDSSNTAFQVDPNSITLPATIPGSGNTSFTVTFGPNARGSSAGTIDIGSDSPENGNFVFNVTGNAVAPVAIVSPGNNIDFDDTVIGGSSTKSVTITNNGDSDLTLEVDPADPLPAQFALDTTLGTLAPNASQTITVVFNPTGTAGTKSGTFGISTNDPNNSSLTFNLAGTALSQQTIALSDFDQAGAEQALTENTTDAAVGEVLYVEKDFGSIDIGSNDPAQAAPTVSENVRIRNNGQVTLDLTAIQIVIDPAVTSFEDDFAVTLADGTSVAGVSTSNPMPIDPSSSIDLTVTLSPQAIGDRPATLEVLSNATNGATVSLPLRGLATSPYLLVKDDDGKNVSAQEPATFPYTPPIAGAESGLELFLKNVGDAPLLNYAISLVNPSDHFSVTGVIPEGGTVPSTLPSGTLPISDSATENANIQNFRVEFHPQILARGLSALIQVTSDNHPTFTFQVTGDSQPTPPGAPDAFGYYYDPNGALNSMLSSGDADVKRVDLSTQTTDSESISIGFPFFFYASSYNRCGVSPYGVITFDDGAIVGRIPALIPTAESTPPNNFIAPFWGTFSSIGHILYTTRGQPGGRSLVIQFTDFQSEGISGNFTFQVILNEGTNDIEFHYFDNGNQLQTSAEPVSIGIQDPFGVGTSYFYGQQDGTALTNPTAEDDTPFISFPSVIRFVRPIRSKVVSAFVGVPNNFTRITCPSTDGLEVGMYISGDPAFSQNLDDDGRIIFPTITEIIDAQTFVISRAPDVSNGTYVPNQAGQITFTSLEASTRDPASGDTAAEEILINDEYSENFDGAFPAKDEVLAGRTPSVQNGQLYLTFDRILSSGLFTNTGGRTSLSIPPLYGSSEGFTAEFDLILKAANNQQPADGFSFNYGDAPLGTTGWEEGMQGVPSVSENLSFEIDTWHNDTGDRSVAISSVNNGVATGDWASVRGNVIDPVRYGNESRGGRMTISWAPDGSGGGTANFTSEQLDGYGVLRNAPNFQNISTPNFEGNDNYTFNLSGRIGGANQDLIIDNLVITTVGRTVTQDTSRTVNIFNCTVDSPDSPDNPMLSSMGVNTIDLGFSPLPGGTYTSAYGAEKGFTAPEFIYLNALYEPLPTPGTVPSAVPTSSPFPADLAVYRLVNDGYSVAGNVVQGANTYFSAALTQDVTVVWRWRLEYALFVEAESVRQRISGLDSDGNPIISPLAAGVGNPIPSVNRHWVPRNAELTASIDRISGDDFLNSDTSGIRYVTVGYDVTTRPAIGQARTTIEDNTIGTTGNRVSASPDNPLIDWAILKWRLMPQVRYRFGAQAEDGTTAGAAYDNQVFLEAFDRDDQSQSLLAFNTGSLTEAWINMYDSVDVGAFYRTSDRCATLTDFAGAQTGDLSSLSTSVSDLADVSKPESILATAAQRIARVHTVAQAVRPTEVTFLYKETIFRAEVPIGESFDPTAPNNQLVPHLCADATLRTGTSGPEDLITPIGPAPPGKIQGTSLRWDQVGQRLLPVQPGIYQVSWPDQDDPTKSYKIEIITGYPGDTVDYPVTRPREQLREADGGSQRQIATTATTLPVYDSSRTQVSGQYYVTSIILANVSPSFPGSISYTTSPQDAHYRHLFDTNAARRAPSRLDLLTTDQWNYIELPYTDQAADPLINPADEGTSFEPQGEGRCVLLYSVRPNPDEAATGDLTKEELVARVVRSESKQSIPVDNSKLVLGRRGLELNDASNLRIEGSNSSDIQLGDSFVVDFWLNGSGMRPDDGDVTIFGVSDDTLKVTLSNNLSQISTTVSSKPQTVLIPFGFTEASDIVVTNISTGELLQEGAGADYLITNGSPVGSPNGYVTILATALNTSVGDQIRVQLADAPAPGGRITATYHDVKVTHPFSTTGTDWHHYVIHVFPSAFFGTNLTVVNFYKDGIREEIAVVTDPSKSTAVIDVDTAASSSALRFGIGADPRSELALDQFRVFSTTSLEKSVEGTSSTDPWLTPEEIFALRTEQDSTVRTRSAVVDFDFEAQPTTGSFPNTGTGANLAIGPIPPDISADPQWIGYHARNDIQEVATRLTSTLDNAGFSGGGYILNEVSNYNAEIYDRSAQVGSWGPLYPVNDNHLFKDNPLKTLEVAYYENPYRTDQVSHPNVAWPYEAVYYAEVQYPIYGSNKDGAIYIASRLGSEGVNTEGQPQEVFSLDRYANFKIYHQELPAAPGYNPNEEHAIAASSNRAALLINGTDEDIPNNPPLAAFALQNGINIVSKTSSYTSDPWVLVQYDDLSTGEPGMAAYEVHQTRSGTIPFPRPSDESVSLVTGLQYGSAENPEDRFLLLDPEETFDFSYNFNYEAMAGDLLIPPYPLNRVIGTATMMDARGGNVGDQRSFWRDVNRNAWIVSGGGQFWHQWFYPFRSDFYLPGAAVGAPVAWVPSDATTPSSYLGDNAVGSPVDDSPKPQQVTYTTNWRSDYPKLKRGETLTYQGGEYFNETPGAQGLPALVAMAAAEIVYDSSTPKMVIDDTTVDSYSARIIRPLDRREAPFSIAEMTNAGFTPASESVLIVAERWYFTDLPGSLQRRFYYDSLAEKLVFRGYLNDKDSGDPDLTAGPDPLNILEPNVMTTTEKSKVLSVASTSTSAWVSAVDTIYNKSLAPDPVRRFNTAGSIIEHPSKDGKYLAGVKEIPAVTLNNSGLSAADQARITSLTNLFNELNRNIWTPFWLLPMQSLLREGQQATYNGLQLDGLTWQNGQWSYEPEEVPAHEAGQFVHLDSFGTGSALVSNPNLLMSSTSGSKYITIAENNRSELDGAPVSLHIVEIIPDRYRGALKVIEGADAFSEKITIQHNGEFGANTGDLYYEWWIRDAAALDLIAEEILDDGTLKEADLEGNSLWQKYLPQTVVEDSSKTEEEKHLGLHSIVFEGRPDVTLADKLILMRYRHRTEQNWKLVPLDYTDAATEWAPAPSNFAGVEAPFQWAGAANSPQLQADGSKRYIPQLVMGWVKRVLDRINPYEARYTDFFGNESPAVYSSQIQIAGAPFAGKVALNPDKNVIENTGLIELYETVLQRARELSIDNSSNPVSTDGINQALLLAATRLAVLYELLAREAYSDAQDGTITISGEDWDLQEVAPYTHAFQNIEASLQHEELALLRGTDFRKSYPVYNRMFWNYAKGLGEAAYNVNYNVKDTNMDGFINEDDARTLYPQGHGDSWGHFLSAMGMHYELLQQRVFQWNSRSELYSLMENVLEVDYLDEKTFAKVAAAKAVTGRDIVRNTYRLHYTQDPDGQWQGYTDDNYPARAWGVSEWGNRTGHAAYFDWAVANAILPDQAEDASELDITENLDLIERSVARDDIGLIATGLYEIQLAMDEANSGVNPLGFDSDTLALDLNVEFYENASGGDRRGHFEQIYSRAVTASSNALATLSVATGASQKLRNRGDTTDDLIKAAFEQDVDFRNELIEIFGRPYDGQIGVGKAFPEGYLGPDTLLYAYLDRTSVEQIIPADPDADLDNPGRGNRSTSQADVTFLDIKKQITGVANSKAVRDRFAFGGNDNNRREAILAYVAGKSYDDPELSDDNGVSLSLPIQRSSAYAYQAASSWGERLSYGLLQNTLQEMLAEEIALQETLGEYAGLLGDLDAIVQQFQNHVNRMQDTSGMTDTLVFYRRYYNTILGGLDLAAAIKGGIGESTKATIEGVAELPPSSIGFSNDIGSGIRGSIKVTKAITETTFNFIEVGITALKLVAERVKEELMAGKERDIGRVESQADLEGFLYEFENLSGGEGPLRAKLGGHLQRLEILRQEYKTHLNRGFSLLRKREAFNKILAASVQTNRYEDMVLRLTRNEVSGKYQTAFNHAARYTWLATRAYDYETSLGSGHPAASGTLLDRIVEERQLGLWVDGEPQAGQGGLAEILANLRDNFGVLKGQLGIDAPQPQTEKMSLRSGLFRIKKEGSASDERWSNALKARCVDDLNSIPEFTRYCRPFARLEDGTQPGLVIRFSSHVEPGLNFFGRPLGAGDHSYSSANYATKIRGMGLWLEDYNSAGLSTTPRAYLVPVGNDYLRTSSSGEPEIRIWNIEERRIPTPYVLNRSDLTSPGFIPSLDGVDGSFGALRRHGDFRIYHDDGDPEADDAELEYDSRLIGRSVWNSDWLLIIPGAGLHSDPQFGLQQLTDAIGDIKLYFTTYSHQGQ